MFHDAIQTCSTPAASPADRRGAPRTPCSREAVILWHHDPTALVRYRLLDISDTGARILTSLPLPEGATGLALRLLPTGKTIDRAILVVRILPRANSTDYELGVRFF